MAALTDEKARADILSRLRRAEGQLRGVQRMIEQGESCIDVAHQFSAARKALDSTYARMTVCLLEQEVRALKPSGKSQAGLEPLLADLQKLLVRA
jgi:DNA-binding FrmR family transcriptional regulator